MTGDALTGQVELETEPTLAHVDRLARDRRHRDAHAQLFVEGVRNFVHAVEHGYEVDTLVVCHKLLKASVARKLAARLLGAGTPFARASPEEFRSISRAEHASGIAAVLRQRLQPLHRVAPRRGRCWLVLDRIRSPGNLGSLVRTSAALGGAGLILLGGAIDPYDPAVVRATMGALFSQTLVRTGAEQLRHWARRHALQIVGATPDAGLPCHALRYRPPPLLVLGDERVGLDAEQRALCHDLVRIPMVAGVDSLNLAVAGSILVYEVTRRSVPQRK